MREKVYRLKTKNKPSSQKWLKRHLNDPYVQKAKEEGYRCRSAFKLLELQKRFSLLKPTSHIVDLGCAPGGWLQVASRFISPEKGKIIGIDRLPIEPLQGIEFHQKDFLCAETIQTLQGMTFHGILSDMAPSFTGHNATDRLQMEELVEAVIVFVKDYLMAHGWLVIKLFQGPFCDILKKSFRTFDYIKPQASRESSREIYGVARDFKGNLF